MDWSLTGYPFAADEPPSGWTITRLRLLAHEVGSGFASGAHNREGTGIPHLRPMNISREGTIDLSDLRFVDRAVDSRRLRRGDVLFNNTNSPVLVGKTALIEEDQELAYSNHMTRIRTGPALDPGFLVYQLNVLFRAGYFAQQCKKHVNQASINPSFIQDEVPILLPPLNEQRRIVAKIDALMARRRRAKESLDAIPPLLERLRQSILAAAFRGDLTADWRAQNPDVEPAEKLLERIRTERRRRWEEATLEKMRAKGKAPTGDGWKAKYEESGHSPEASSGALPSGWAWTTWSAVGFCQNGTSFPSSAYQNSGVRLLRPGNMDVSGELRWTVENTRCLPEEYSQAHSDHIVGENELVMNLTAQSLKDQFLGRVCLAGSGERCLLNQRIARLTPVLISSEFAFWVFRSPRFRSYVDAGLNSGSLIQHIFTKQVDAFVLPLPSLQEQEEICRRLRAANRMLAGLQVALERGMEAQGVLDRAILAKAFRGELVPQDPNDEPAEQMLARLASTEALTKAKRGRPRQKDA